MQNDLTKIRLNSRYSIRIEPCIDGEGDTMEDLYVWTLQCDGQDVTDGYESTAEDAEAKARDAYQEHLQDIEDEEAAERDLRDRRR